jgi:hypothetical protein
VNEIIPENVSPSSPAVEFISGALILTFVPRGSVNSGCMNLLSWNRLFFSSRFISSKDSFMLGADAFGDGPLISSTMPMSKRAFVRLPRVPMVLGESR